MISFQNVATIVQSAMAANNLPPMYEPVLYSFINQVLGAIANDPATNPLVTTLINQFLATEPPLS